MDAAKLKEILKTQYGINNEEEFNVAVEKSLGVNIGIFSMPLSRGCKNEQKTEKKISA